MILTMTYRPQQSKVLLVSDSRVVTADQAQSPIRRYRIARLRIDARRSPGAAQFEQAKR